MVERYERRPPWHKTVRCKRGKINKVSEREKVQSDKIALLPFFQTLAHGAIMKCSNNK